MTPAPDQTRVSRNRRRGDSVGLMMRLGLALAVVIVIAVVFNIVIHKLERSPPVQPEYVQKKSAEELDRGKLPVVTPPDFVQGIVDLEGKRPLIEEVLRAFYLASTVDDRLAFCRDPDRVRPLMQDYYRKHPLRSLAVVALGSCQSVGEKGYQLGYIEVKFSQSPTVSIIVEEGMDGQFRVDWESLVRYGEMDWEDFLKQKPKEPILLRVIASQSKETGVPGREWLEILSPGSGATIKAYFDRRDPKLQNLVDQLQLGGWKNVPLTLRLCYSDVELNADAAQIAGIEGKGWLILN